MNNNDQNLVNTEIQTLENMNELLKKDTDSVAKIKEETPTEKVEKKLSDFIADAFKATCSDFAFLEALKQDGLRRLSSMSDAQYIAFLGSSQVNMNDRISKLIAPTFGMMQTKQQAEIAAAKQMASQQVIVNPQGGNNVVANPAQALSGDAKEISDIINGGAVLTQLLQALGQDSPNPTTESTQN